MDINRYMAEMVEPTIKEFAANRTSRRHAFLACVVTFHSIDYLTCPKKPANRRQSFRKRSREFAMVDRIAHAIKHVETGDNRNVDFQPLRVEDVIEPSPAGWTGLGLDLSNWGGAKGVTLKNEGAYDLLEIVKGAADFIRSQIDP
jgi:hypothetical protein